MKTNLLLSLLTAAILTACGGGGTDNAATQAFTGGGGGGAGGTETRVTRQAVSNVASVAQTQAVQYYQALTGKAPGYYTLRDFTTYIGQGLTTSYMNVVIQQTGINAMTDVQLAALVLKNLNITATTLNSTAQFGTSAVMYANLEAAVADYFNATGKANRAVVISQLAGIVAGMENETTFGVYGNAAVGFNKQVAANYVYSSNTANYVSAVVAVIEKLPPIPVQASSYLNAKNINVPPQVMPQADGVSFIESTKSPSNTYEIITAGWALADFFQDGTYSMVGFSNVFVPKGDPRDAGNTQMLGHVYFYKKDSNGKWVDKSADLLSANDRTGCFSPRKVIVADFNGDGKPDVFAACHGVDIANGPGEHPRYLLSQPNGTYKNVETTITCYCHGASAAELNSKGYADIVVTDTAIAKKPFYLVNNKNGTFTADYTRMHAEVDPWVFEGQTTVNPRQIYSTELVDINGDGKFDLFLNGNESAVPLHQWQTTSSIYLNDGFNKFNTSSIKFPSTLAYKDSLIVDIIVKDSKIAVLRTNYTRTDVDEYSYPSMSVIRTASVPNGDTFWFNLYNGSIIGAFAVNKFTVAF